VILRQRHISRLTSWSERYGVLLRVHWSEIPKKHLTLNRVHLAIDITHDFVPQALGLPLRDLIAISKLAPNLLFFDFILSDQHLSPVPPASARRGRQRTVDPRSVHVS